MFANRKITGLYKEFTVPLWIGVLLLLTVSAAVFLPWLGSERELFRNESLHAVIAQEFSSSSPVPTAHHVQLLSDGIIHQAAASILHRVSGLSLVSSLRTVSLLMLTLTAILAGISASSRSSRAGLTAAAVVMSTMIAIDKVPDGFPATTSAFFLLSAQLAFFYYGIRKANWNMAWIVSAALILLAFASGGFRMLIYFVFPLLFLRHYTPRGKKKEVPLPREKPPSHILPILPCFVGCFHPLVSCIIFCRNATERKQPSKPDRSSGKWKKQRVLYAFAGKHLTRVDDKFKLKLEVETDDTERLSARIG